MFNILFDVYRKSLPSGECSPVGSGATGGRPLPRHLHHPHHWHHHRNQQRRCAGRSQVRTFGLYLANKMWHFPLTNVNDDDDGLCAALRCQNLRMQHRKWHHRGPDRNPRSVLLHLGDVRKRRAASEGFHCLPDWMEGKTSSSSCQAAQRAAYHTLLLQEMCV